MFFIIKKKEYKRAIITTEVHQIKHRVGSSLNDSSFTQVPASGGIIRWPS